MGVLFTISAISASSVAFLIYFGFALWRDERQQGGRRVLILKLREKIARKRRAPRVLYMHRIDAIRLPRSERARNL
jgi:hypothetical protein